MENHHASWDLTAKSKSSNYSWQFSIYATSFFTAETQCFFWVHDMFTKRQSDAKRFPVLEAHSQICQEIGRGTRQVEARNHVAAEVGTAVVLGAILGGPGGPGGHEWS